MSQKAKYPAADPERSNGKIAPSGNGTTFAAMAVLLIGEIPIAVLPTEQTAAFLGIGQSTLWDKLNTKSPRHDALLPKPLELGERNRGFLVSELWAYLNKKAALRSNGS